VRLTICKKLTPVLLGLVSITFAGLLFAAPPTPDIPKGKGEQCVEPTDLMRKNHMDMLKHQRDLTMREGVRTKKYSLVECIECHVVPDEKGDFPQYGTNEHFCSTCHSYASVNIDCFQCHATKPDNNGYRHSLNNSGAEISNPAGTESLTASDIDIVTAENQ
jgi:hypothetical protein